MKRILLTAFVISICLIGKSQYNSAIIIEPILKTDTTSAGQKIVFPHFQDEEITILKITILPGESTGWHKHEVPVFAYILEGTLTVELENNQTFEFHKGSSFAEVINTFHNGVNQAKENIVLLAFYMGEKGKALSLHKESVKEK